MQAHQILLVEDEQAIADTLIYALGSEGFCVTHLMLGRPVLAALHDAPFDLIVLDIGLPDTTGFEILKALRADAVGRDMPVIFLTARSEEIDRILGLELGADDYVTKPFSPREVAARVRAILRREARVRTRSQDDSVPCVHRNNQSVYAAPEHVSASCWRHEPEALRIAYRGQWLDLTRYEYLLLALLLSAPGRVFTRDQIMSRVWANAPDTADRSIDTHIKTLRAKLRAINAAAEPIVTHRGTGYALAEHRS